MKRKENGEREMKEREGEKVKNEGNGKEEVAICDRDERDEEVEEKDNKKGNIEGGKDKNNDKKKRN